MQQVNVQGTRDMPKGGTRNSNILPSKPGKKGRENGSAPTRWVIEICILEDDCGKPVSCSDVLSHFGNCRHFAPLVETPEVQNGSKSTIPVGNQKRIPSFDLCYGLFLQKVGQLCGQLYGQYLRMHLLYRGVVILVTGVL